MAGSASETSIAIPVASEGVRLNGDLSIPPGARGLVIFAHGSGSSRFSSRNRHVAAVLGAAGLGTLLFDLLTETEEEIDLRTHHLRFDIDLLSRRLVGVVDWLHSEPSTAALRLGLFGASTGAAAALTAAAERPGAVAAVVSRGGRPDLAPAPFEKVKAPTLLVVGAFDFDVIQLNQWAFERLRCVKELRIVPGATHLFEEHGTLDMAASLAREWFTRYLQEPPAGGPPAIHDEGPGSGV